MDIILYCDKTCHRNLYCINKINMLNAHVFNRGGTPRPSMSCIATCMSQCLNMREMVPDSNSCFIPRTICPSGASKLSTLIAPQCVLFTCQYSSRSLSSHCDQNSVSVYYDYSHAWPHSQVQHLSMHTARPGTAIRIVTRL